MMNNHRPPHMILRTIFNAVSFGTNIDERKRVARSLNCTNSEGPPTPPAMVDGCAVVQKTKRKPRTQKPEALKKTYRPNPSFPAEMMPDLQRLAADSQKCVGAFIVDLCSRAIREDGGAGGNREQTGNLSSLNLTAGQWRSLYGVANNLNQITKRLHGTGECDPKLQILLFALINILGVDEE